MVLYWMKPMWGHYLGIRTRWGQCIGCKAQGRPLYYIKPWQGKCMEYKVWRKGLYCIKTGRRQCMEYEAWLGVLHGIPGWEGALYSV